MPSQVTPPFELRTFGALSLSSEGTPVEALGSKRLVFLAVLAASGPSGAPRERLAALFWPESDEERARSALHQLVYVFRRALGDATVIAGPTNIRIDDGRLHSDVAAFMRAVHERRFADAVQHCVGPFLDGVHAGRSPDLERWIEEMRARLSRQHLRALAARRDESFAGNQHREAIRWAELVFAADPSSGAATLALMEALVVANEIGAALRAADHHAAWMRVELEAPPDDRARAFAATLRARRADPSSIAEAPARPPGVVAAADTSIALPTARTTLIPA